MEKSGLGIKRCDRFLKLPTNDLCEFAMKALISAYQSAVQLGAKNSH